MTSHRRHRVLLACAGLWVCAGLWACGDGAGPGATVDSGPTVDGHHPDTADARTVGPACTSDDDCENDTYCDPDTHTCVPYGDGDTDQTCTNVVVIGVFTPAIQCEWVGPPDGDAFPGHRNVLGTPMVADFDLDGDPATIHPSMVFQSYEGEDGGNESCVGSDATFGVIRVVSGADCTQQYTLPPPKTVASTPVALADLDLAADNRPEIVAQRIGGGLVAYKYNATADDFEVLWQTTSTLGQGTCLWSGPSIHDLDGDGNPEVIMGGSVFNGQTGDAIDESLGLLKVSNGRIPVIADVESDGSPELITGDAVYEWSAATSQWQPVTTDTGDRGLVALADFGTFGATAADDDRATLDGIPEVAVISAGQARLQTLAGRTFFGPVTLKFFNTDNPGSGGPPTAADFDGDGRAEFAVAGRGGYNVFDPDCDADPDPTTCATGTTDGILWASPTQDFSSSVTGSSVFDFEGDGRAEAVYGDECFSRVYDGKNGDVLYSQFRTSCTWYENPIVADVDGDFRSEIVIPSNSNCDVVCPEIDPLFPGLRCETDAECPLATTCKKEDAGDDFGLCRCTATADCGGNGYVCVDPIAGPSPAGQVCRASHPAEEQRGVRVIRDALDRWVSSRPIWNQHAYAVTNVTDSGQIPATGSWAANWITEGLNNFRQNVVGDLGADVSPDATANGNDFACDSDGLKLEARVCNRGTEPLAAGVPVTFYEGDPAGDPICTALTAGTLNPGSCEVVSCSFAPAPAEPVDVTVVADDDGTGRGESSECHEGNNRSVIKGVGCGSPE